MKWLLIIAAALLGGLGCKGPCQTVMCTCPGGRTGIKCENSTDPCNCGLPGDTRPSDLRPAGDLGPADNAVVDLAGAADAGGSDGGPCAAPLPQPAAGSNLSVEVYATFDTRPGGVSFDTAGNLFVGNFGKDAADDPSAIWKVSPTGGQSSSTSKIYDPDVLIVDIDGKVGAKGHVLIGGKNNQTQLGVLTQMTPDLATATELSTDSCLGNINHLIFHPDGRLLATNYDEANVCAIVGGTTLTVTELIAAGPPLGAKVNTTVPGPDGSLYVTSQDPSNTSQNLVHKFAADGTLIQASFASGSAVAYGPAGGPFEGLLLFKSGELRRLDTTTGQSQVLATGGFSSLAAFDGNGHLFMTDANNHRVIRIAPTGTPSPGACP